MYWNGDLLWYNTFFWDSRNASIQCFITYRRGKKHDFNYLHLQQLLRLAYIKALYIKSTIFISQIEELDWWWKKKKLSKKTTSWPRVFPGFEGDLMVEPLGKLSLHFDSPAAFDAVTRRFLVDFSIESVLLSSTGTLFRCVRGSYRRFEVWGGKTLVRFRYRYFRAFRSSSQAAQHSVEV